jgi:hypothetical protein
MDHSTFHWAFQKPSLGAMLWTRTIRKIIFLLLCLLSFWVALESSWWVNKHFANLPKTLGVNSLSRNIRNTRHLLKNVLLNTLELKNALGCLGKQSMCHQSSGRHVANGVLGKDIKKKSKMHSRYLELSWALECFQKHLINVNTFYTYQLPNVCNVE